jgi:molecular chaperone Hsp33
MERGMEDTMKDYIVRMLAKDAPIKAMAIQGRGLVQRAREIHNTLPVATAALGRALMAASLMGQQLKEEEGSLTLRIDGGGPLGKILVVSDSSGNVRGYVQNGMVELPLKGPAKLDVGTAVGPRGTLTVIKDLRMREPYVGTIPLASGEIAEDITAYFAESEQIPTACALGVLVDRDLSVAVAGGYLIQLLPGAEEEHIAKIEQGIARAGDVTAQLAQVLTAEELLELVLGDFQLEVLEKAPVEYRCYCSRERMQTALLSMGKEELHSLIADLGRAEMTCQFCDAVHVFEREELEALADAL